MSVLIDGSEAVVLRTTRYGEADVIAHVHTRDAGRRGVIAKGALRAKSRLGTRLEPFLAVRLQLVEGRGELAIVRQVDVVAGHEHVRASWRAQQLAASAVDLAGQLGEEHEPNEPLHNLLRSFLAHLDVLTDVTGSDELDHRGRALLTAFELKLLHVAGTTPQLGACVRCGDSTGLTRYSPSDGGVVCVACEEPGDVRVDAVTHAATVDLLRSPLADVVRAEEPPPLSVLRAVERSIVAPTLAEHAGVRLR